MKLKYGAVLGQIGAISSILRENLNPMVQDWAQSLQIQEGLPNSIFTIDW